MRLLAFAFTIAFVWTGPKSEHLIKKMFPLPRCALLCICEKFAEATSGDVCFIFCMSGCELKCIGDKQILCLHKFGEI